MSRRVGKNPEKIRYQISDPIRYLVKKFDTKS